MKILCRLIKYNPYYLLDNYIQRLFKTQPSCWCNIITSIIHCSLTCLLCYNYINYEISFIAKLISLNSIIYFINDMFNNEFISVLNFHHIISIYICYVVFINELIRFQILKLYLLAELSNYPMYVEQLLSWSNNGKYWKSTKIYKYLIFIQTCSYIYYRIYRGFNSMKLFETTELYYPVKIITFGGYWWTIQLIRKCYYKYIK
jgi:hypothetical protein